jgi:hypothetical protein
MHALALIYGAWLHVFGDFALWVTTAFIARGPAGYVYDEYFEYPSRYAAAFALLPVPLGVSIGGLILAWWGFAGM